MFTVFLALMILFAGGYVVTTMLMMGQLQKRKIPINWFLIRLYLPKYLHQYSQIIKQETGKVPPLFYVWWGSLGGMAALAIVVIVMKALD